jgi:hypothetical protein
MTPERPTLKQEGYRGAKEVKAELLGPRPVGTMPGDLFRMLPELGGGRAVAHFELLEKLAYVSIMGPDHENGSEYQAVLARLEKPAPELHLRPLPMVDGRRVANTGVQFKKDPTFMGLFLVEGANAKAIGKWLTRPLRKALGKLPDAWLVVRGQAMALAIYGPMDADRLYALVEVADALFAEHGDEGGPSLFLDEEDEGGEDEADGEDEDAEDEESGKGKAAPAGVKGAGKGKDAPAAAKGSGKGSGKGASAKA